MRYDTTLPGIPIRREPQKCFAQIGRRNLKWKVYSPNWITKLEVSKQIVGEKWWRKIVGVAEKYLLEYFSLQSVVSIMVNVFEIMPTEMKSTMPAFSKLKFP